MVVADADKPLGRIHERFQLYAVALQNFGHPVCFCFSNDRSNDYDELTMVYTTKPGRRK